MSATDLEGSEATSVVITSHPGVRCGYHTRNRRSLRMPTATPAKRTHSKVYKLWHIDQMSLIDIHKTIVNNNNIYIYKRSYSFTTTSKVDRRMSTWYFMLGSNKV